MTENEYENNLWNKLCKKKSLLTGWHLTKTDMKSNFAEYPYLKESFAFFLDENIEEISRLLQTSDFRPHYLTRIDIPKGNLGIRPGTILPIEDSVILFSALALVVEKISETMIEEVYSYQLKKKDKRKRSLFRDGDAITLPFLKDKTINKFISDHESWYKTWPEFDKISKKAFQEDDYIFMATSDIAAYFENIQLDILRDQLSRILPNEPKIVNLFLNAFNSWTYDTPQGRYYSRGIPQGNDVSGFFGNIFLQPIDKIFQDFIKDKDIRYYRYMDDIRIFTKKEIDAKRAIFLLDKEIRGLHLNLQNAKTKIYDERSKGITMALIDNRLLELEKHFNDIQSERSRTKGVIDREFRKSMQIKLDVLLKKNPHPKSKEKKIYKAREPLGNLTNRLFRRLIIAHNLIGSDKMIPRLLSEIEKNSDSRMTERLISCSRQFPRKKIQDKLLKFIKSEENIFQYQEAQILKAFRYQSRISEEVFDYVIENLEKDLQGIPNSKILNDFTRSEMLHLLSRVRIDKKIIDIAKEYFDGGNNDIVKNAASLILIQQRGNYNREFIQKIVLHPNESIRKLGKFYRGIKYDESQVKATLKQAFSVDYCYLLVDYIPILSMFIESGRESIINMVIDKIKKCKADTKHENMDMRDRCREILFYGKQNISDLESKEKSN